jgi:hypothetical protein
MHKFQALEQKMTQIRSGRLSLHSDFIDINKAKKEQLKEMQEKKKWTSAFGNNLRQSNATSNQPVLSPKSKQKMDLIKKNEQSQFEAYI